MYGNNMGDNGSGMQDGMAMAQEIGQIVAENNAMLKEIGQMLAQAMGGAEPSMGENPGGAPEPDQDEMLRQEAMRRLAAKQGA